MGLSCKEPVKHKYIVIGEGQAAIESYAATARQKHPDMEFRTISKEWSSIVKKSGAARLPLGSEAWELKAVEGNADWIEEAHNEGYSFIDIGQDSSENRSPFYLAEKKRISDIDAKIYRAPKNKVSEARKDSKVSNRPPSKTMEELKKKGLI